ncbi:hypothetical protein [Candidatus Liberibacter solanacearum]|uniref:hypothetical protein n=1 Tax=Candidatus Liberibacter solanacearum TaxID=556287 RepID=UPI001300D9D8|nr:hypothetical protein [Candidatus Liberibacter solanacearum]
MLESPDYSNPSSGSHSPDSMGLQDFLFSSPYIVREREQPSDPDHGNIDFAGTRC